MMQQERNMEYPKVLLVGLCTKNSNEFENSMQELSKLAKACYKEVVCIITQRMETPSKATYVGSGKIEEIKDAVRDMEINEIIFDNELSPVQLRNLQDEIQIPIYDRTLLILQIFALRARSKESMLQVEVARLQYMLPRLVGLHKELGRQGGGSGSLSNKGSGEKKMELDRRKIEHRITQLKKELQEVEKNRETQRKKRRLSTIPQVSLVGYTNAGKSTIMNRFIEEMGISEEKKVFEKDMLFATLDTSVRIMDFHDRKPFYLTDTVGFVQNLPHGLVETFHSTLEEVKYADLLVQVVDLSDESFKEQMETTSQTLEEIGASQIPMVVVYNKADIAMKEYPVRNKDSIRISAKDKESLKELLNFIQSRIYSHLEEKSFFFPYENGKDLAFLLNHAKVQEKEFEEEGVRVCALADQKTIARVSSYLLS